MSLIWKTTYLPLTPLQGDSILNQALSEIGGKGLFTKELDVALLDNTVSGSSVRKTDSIPLGPGHPTACLHGTACLPAASRRSA
jgi:hypothetical protein